MNDTNVHTMPKTATEKTKNFYYKLHSGHTDAISQDLAIPLSYMWGLPESFFNNKIIVEAGCGGMGTQAIQLQMLHPKELLVIDLSPDNIVLAQKNFSDFFHGKMERVRFQQLDLGSILLPKDTFDIVHHRGVFQHIEHKNFALKNFNQCLKMNGYFLVNTYGKGGLLAFISNTLRFVFRFIPEKRAIQFVKFFIKSPDYVSGIIDHLYVPIQKRFTKKQFIRYVEQFGFKMERYVGNQYIDYSKMHVPYKSRLFRFITIYLTPESKQRIKWLSFILYGDFAHKVIFKKVVNV